MIQQRVTVPQQLERAEREGWGYTGDMATEREVLEFLFGLVRVEKPEICVETGTYHGHGTQAIVSALELNKRGHLWTVENADYEYLPKDRVTYVTGDSVEWASVSAPDFCDLALLDCGPPEVRVQVMANIWPKINESGIVLVHDCLFYQDEFLAALEEASGQRANVTFPALNGLALWRKK